MCPSQLFCEHGESFNMPRRTDTEQRFHSVDIAWGTIWLGNKLRRRGSCEIWGAGVRPGGWDVVFWMHYHTGVVRPGHQATPLLLLVAMTSSADQRQLVQTSPLSLCKILRWEGMVVCTSDHLRWHPTISDGIGNHLRWHPTGNWRICASPILHLRFWVKLVLA